LKDMLSDFDPKTQGKLYSEVAADTWGREDYSKNTVLLTATGEKVYPGVQAESSLSQTGDLLMREWNNLKEMWNNRNNPKPYSVPEPQQQLQNTEPKEQYNAPEIVKPEVDVVL